MKKMCIADSCEQPSRARGLCNSHYRKYRYRANPKYVGPRRFDDINESFAARTKVSGACTIWTGKLHPAGHGYVNTGGSSRFAHLVAYELAVGKVPDGMVLDHICRNPPCVTIAHLRVVTRKQNGENRDGPNKNNTTSKRLGVSFDKRTKRWTAKVMHERKSYWAGRHNTEEEAAEAARQLRLSLFTHNDIDYQPPPEQPEALADAGAFAMTKETQ